MCARACVRACERACVRASSVCLRVFVCVSFCASKSCLLTFNTYSQDKLKNTNKNNLAVFCLLLLVFCCCCCCCCCVVFFGVVRFCCCCCFCFGVVYTNSNTKAVQLSSGSCECPLGGRKEGDYCNMFDRKIFKRQPEALICFWLAFLLFVCLFSGGWFLLLFLLFCF